MIYIAYTDPFSPNRLNIFQRWILHSISSGIPFMLLLMLGLHINRLEIEIPCKEFIAFFFFIQDLMPQLSKLKLGPLVNWTHVILNQSVVVLPCFQGWEIFKWDQEQLSFTFPESAATPVGIMSLCSSKDNFFFSYLMYLPCGFIRMNSSLLVNGFGWKSNFFQGQWERSKGYKYSSSKLFISKMALLQKPDKCRSIS